MLRISARHLANLVARNKIASVRIGRRRFISRAEVVRIATEGVA